MEWYIGLALFIAIIAALVLVRTPIALALLGASLLASLYLFGFQPSITLISLGIASSLLAFGLSPVPMFVLMGEVLFLAKIAERALRAIKFVVPRLPAQLALIATGAGAILSSVSGSPLATTALLANSLLPEMRQSQYNIRLAMGSILASGGLAMIIPPSTNAVVLGATAGIPVGPILIAGLIPGVLMAIGYSTVILVWARLGGIPGTPVVLARPEAVAVTEAGDARDARDLRAERQESRVETDFDGGSRSKVLFKYVLPLGLIIFLVVGLILLGVATPTESSATGVIGAVVLAAAYGQLSRRLVRQAVGSTTRLVGSILLIVASAGIFAQLMAASGIVAGAIRFILSFELSTTGTLVILLLTIVFLGLFLEAVAMILITAPFFMPIIAALGVDPVWFAILWLIAIQIGLTTPPFGLSLFVIKRFVPEASLKDTYMAAVPFILSDVVVITLLFAFPILVTWLPDRAFS